MGYHDRNGAADLAEQKAVRTDEELRRLLKRFSVEAAEQFRDQIEKIGVEADEAKYSISELIEDVLIDAVRWPDVERARENVLAAE